MIETTHDASHVFHSSASWILELCGCPLPCAKWLVPFILPSASPPPQVQTVTPSFVFVYFSETFSSARKGAGLRQQRRKGTVAPLRRYGGHLRKPERGAFRSRGIATGAEQRQTISFGAREDTSRYADGTPRFGKNSIKHLFVGRQNRCAHSAARSGRERGLHPTGGRASLAPGCILSPLRGFEWKLRFKRETGCLTTRCIDCDESTTLPFLSPLLPGASA